MGDADVGVEEVRRTNRSFDVSLDEAAVDGPRFGFVSPLAGSGALAVVAVVIDGVWPEMALGADNFNEGTLILYEDEKRVGSDVSLPVFGFGSGNLLGVANEWKNEKT